MIWHKLLEVLFQTMGVYFSPNSVSLTYNINNVKKYLWKEVDTAVITYCHYITTEIRKRENILHQQ